MLIVLESRSITNTHHRTLHCSFSTAVPSPSYQDLKSSIHIKHREFFDGLYETLHLTNREGWYNVSQKDVINRGGGIILSNYNNSLSKSLSTLYPGTTTPEIQ